jgi:hypothetical protein
VNFLDPRLPDRFWRKCIPEPMSGCWLWTACHTRDGYGAFARRVTADAPLVKRVAHRFAYEVLVGPVPTGLQLDHKCRVRGCVNPAHLEPVTNRENQMRGVAFVVANANKTHCNHGHEFNEENTRLWRGHRYCRPCCNRRSSESRTRSLVQEAP